jgi:FAD:protein FMN transferase
MLEFSRRIPLVGDEIEVVLYDVDPELAEVLVGELKDEGERLQKIFNAFDPESELSRLNRKRKMRVSEHLLKVIKLALRYCELSDGTHDISLGRQFMQRKQGVKITPLKCTFRDITIDGDTITLRSPDAQIDLGSVAKGYIGDMLAIKLKEAGVLDAFLDLRGDIIFYGDHEELVEIEHPREENKTLWKMQLKNAAVATSGDYRQFDGSFDQSHIIGKNNIISATVIADTLAEADAAATCLMVMGEGKRTQLSNIKYLTMDEGTHIIRSEGFPDETP